MSNDLISRKEVIRLFGQVFDSKDEFGSITIIEFMNILSYIPTAYDVDKVVEEIKELRSNPDLYVYGVDAYTKAIEIVRKGGVENA